LGYGELLNHWSDVRDISYYGNSKDTSEDGDTVFVFDPANTDAGILTITLKAITNTHSSERVLQLELMAESVSNGDDLCKG
jgi:hypothetical protein